MGQNLEPKRTVFFGTEGLTCAANPHEKDEQYSFSWYVQTTYRNPYHRLYCTPKEKKTRAHDVHDAAGPCRCMTPAGHRVFSRHHQLITRCSDDQSWLTIQLLARVQLCCVRVLRAMAAALL